MNIFFYYLVISVLSKRSESYAFTLSTQVYKNLPTLNETNNITSHLAYSHIMKECGRRDYICKSNDTKVCTIRKLNETFEYEDFENSCYLFLSNMCDNPGNEFYIVDSESCDIYLKSSSRRHYEFSGVSMDGVNPATNSSKDNSSAHGNTTKPGLRTFSYSPLYGSKKKARDGHWCQSNCTNVYAPVCLVANRLRGKHQKLFQFVNHCEADRFYCKNSEELRYDKTKPEEVHISEIANTYCASTRFVSFSLISKFTSSMGRYGWLEGDYNYAKILEPHQRRPGFG